MWVRPTRSTAWSLGKMGITPSSRWLVVTLDLEDSSLELSSEDEALHIAREEESGTIGATGETGDCVEMQFDRAHALVLYMAADQTILRPQFLHREVSGEGVEEFFCECCGVQLGNKTEMLSRGCDHANPDEVAGNPRIATGLSH